MAWRGKWTVTERAAQGLGHQENCCGVVEELHTALDTKLLEEMLETSKRKILYSESNPPHPQVLPFPFTPSEVSGQFGPSCHPTRTAKIPPHPKTSHLLWPSNLRMMVSK